MITSLPHSLDKSRHSIRKEVAYARSLSPEQRLIVVAKVCKAGLRILNLHEHRQRVLTLRDPVPESTTAAFRRLRNEL